MSNKKLIEELTAELKAFDASQKAYKESIKLKCDFPPLKRTWRFKEWTGLSHIHGRVK